MALSKPTPITYSTVSGVLAVLADDAKAYRVQLGTLEDVSGLKEGDTVSASWTGGSAQAVYIGNKVWSFEGVRFLCAPPPGKDVDIEVLRDGKMEYRAALPPATVPSEADTRMVPLALKLTSRRGALGGSLRLQVQTSSAADQLSIEQVCPNGKGLYFLTVSRSNVSEDAHILEMRQIIQQFTETHRGEISVKSISESQFQERAMRPRLSVTLWFKYKQKKKTTKKDVTETPY
mmetsp:Transcript_37929/g.95345  ORF Transcript_37929/g.95345 Transcript_37929/m.95345 type:complete len:233 (+) Transcript_37929:62-760(+)